MTERDVWFHKRYHGRTSVATLDMLELIIEFRWQNNWDFLFISTEFSFREASILLIGMNDHGWMIIVIVHIYRTTRKL